MCLHIECTSLQNCAVKKIAVKHIYSKKLYYATQYKMARNSLHFLMLVKQDTTELKFTQPWYASDGGI